MSPAQTRIDALPEVFPVFPLTGALLLPGGQLPLNIFEPRYLALTEDALSNGRMFAMIQPDRAKPALNHGPSLFRVGCLGRLTSFAETDDGRFLITLTGIVRFDLVEEVEMQRGYRRVHGNFRRFAADLGPHQLDGFDRPGLLDSLRHYFAHRGFDANWKAIGALDDEALITNLAMVCPFEPMEKQALLEAPTLADRAQALRALLRIDAHDQQNDEDGSTPGRLPS